jgi:tetratricopeptide (TPR) repeat protein
MNRTSFKKENKGVQKRIILILIIGACFLRLVEARTPNIQYGKVFYRFGLRSEKDNNFEQAIKLYQRSIQHNPKLAKAYFSLGLIYFSQKKFEEAYVCLNKSRNLVPNSDDIDSTSSFYLAHILRDQGNFKQAIQEFQRASRTSHTKSRTVQCQFEKGVTYILNKEAYEASEIARELNVLGYKDLSKKLYTQINSMDY